MRNLVCISILAAFGAGMAMGDEVTDWNRIMLDAFMGPPAVSPPLAARPAAIVAAAVFDAVNGDRAALHADSRPGGGAFRSIPSRRGRSGRVYQPRPAFPGTDAHLRRPADRFPRGDRERSGGREQRIDPAGDRMGPDRGGCIWVWRSNDGFSNVQPPFTGGLAPGQWRPTPPAYAPGLGRGPRQSTCERRWHDSVFPPCHPHDHAADCAHWWRPRCDALQRFHAGHCIQAGRGGRNLIPLSRLASARRMPASTQVSHFRPVQRPWSIRQWT
jgi:hypothetical protein